MNAARQMKLEMTLRRREQRLTERDQRELDRFREVLQDKASMPEEEWRKKHAEYLGL